MGLPRKDELRAGLVGFFATLAFLSLLLNGYLAWKLYRPGFLAYFSRFRKPAAVTGDDHVRGPVGAPVTLIEYADFQCPFCKRFHASIKTIASERKIRWVFRHFPLESHPLAERLAEASECAGDQGKFWEFADLLYERPVQSGSMQSLAEQAQAMGLNGERFRACLMERQDMSRVASQKKEGVSLWISGTPTFFLNGKRYVGALPVDQIRGLMSNR